VDHVDHLVLGAKGDLLGNLAKGLRPDNKKAKIEFVDHLCGPFSKIAKYLKIKEKGLKTGYLWTMFFKTQIAVPPFAQPLSVAPTL